MSAYARESYSDKKTNYRKNMNELLDKYDKIILVGVDNVRSKQIQQIRMATRGKAILLMGKNTQMKKVLLDRMNESGSERDKLLYAKLSELLVNNVGLVFTDGDLPSLKALMESNKVQAAAKAGAIAPCSVSVPAGNTGLEPTKTTFFQALNIGTKITKGTVEILKDVELIKEGEKVGSSEATLLQMLKITPFFYGLTIEQIYEGGSVYNAKVLDMSEDDIIEQMSGAMNKCKGLALGLGIPTKYTVGIQAAHVFRQFMAVMMETDYSFTEFGAEEFKQQILSGPSPSQMAAASSAAPAAAAAAPAAAEEEEDEDEDMGFGLFD